MYIIIYGPVINSSNSIKITLTAAAFFTVRCNKTLMATKYAKNVKFNNNNNILKRQ